MDSDLSISDNNFAVSVLKELQKRKYLNSEDADRATRAFKAAPGNIDTILIELGLISDSDLAVFWSQWLDIPLLNTDEHPEIPIHVPSLSERFLNVRSIAPLSLKGELLAVAMSAPYDRDTVSMIEFATGFKVEAVVASRTRVLELLENLSNSSENAQSQQSDNFLSGKTLEGDIEHLVALANDGPIVRRVNDVFTQALNRNASDVHFEPSDQGLLVRFRIDGKLCDVELIESESSAAIVSRVKIMGQMDISERRLPQDGRATMNIRGNNIDLRIAAIRTIYGESIVVRLLRRDFGVLTWDKLGFTSAVKNNLLRILSFKNGIFLVVGPTGSGKTTTLSTAFSHLNKRDKKLISAEDPVEHFLKGVNQIQVHPEIGFGFPVVLRSILRHDFDDLMIGEVRDEETAKFSTRAALTGHRVLTSLHTGSAAAAITRLIEMGVPRYLVADCVRGVLSQRLVRLLCTSCRRKHEDLFDPTTLGSRSKPIEHWYEAGCDKCGNSGYQGRTVITELLVVNSKIRELILTGKGEEKIHETAIELGMECLLDSGLELVRKGVTTIEEVTSVTELIFSE